MYVGNVHIVHPCVSKGWEPSYQRVTYVELRVFIWIVIIV